MFFQVLPGFNCIENSFKLKYSSVECDHDCLRVKTLYSMFGYKGESLPTSKWSPYYLPMICRDFSHPKIGLTHADTTRVSDACRHNTRVHMCSYKCVNCYLPPKIRIRWSILLSLIKLNHFGDRFVKFKCFYILILGNS